MYKTYAALQVEISAALQDTTNLTYTTAILDALMPRALVKVSEFVPRPSKETIATTSSSKEMTLTAGLKYGLIAVEKVEYPITDTLTIQYFPRFKVFGDVIRIDDNYPSLPNGDNASLYLLKVHLLQQAIGTTDTAGTLNGGHALGVSSLVLAGLGTGTINKDTSLAIVGDSTTYRVIETVTIAGNAATVSIAPPLVAAALTGAVVNLALATSTMDSAAEDAYVDYCAGMAMMERGNEDSLIRRQGSIVTNLRQQGADKMGMAISKLRGMIHKTPASAWG